MILKMKYYSGRQVHNIITETIAGKTLADVLERFAIEPSADVREVEHGRWLDLDAAPGGLFYATCSVCGERQVIEVANYCPMCGAKLSKEENE